MSRNAATTEEAASVSTGAGSTDSVKPEPELRCFGSGCQERGPFASEATAGMHENAYHDGAQTVFLVEPNATGLGWQMAGTWRS